jgi:hypothetical protein
VRRLHHPRRGSGGATAATLVLGPDLDAGPDPEAAAEQR